MQGYITKKEIGERAARLLEEDERTQKEIANDLDIPYTNLSKAKDLEKHPYYMDTAATIIWKLEGKVAQGPYWRLVDQDKI